jgi:hypothetical protein
LSERLSHTIRETETAMQTDIETARQRHTNQ